MGKMLLMCLSANRIISLIERCEMTSKTQQLYWKLIRNEQNTTYDKNSVEDGLSMYNYGIICIDDTFYEGLFHGLDLLWEWVRSINIVIIISVYVFMIVTLDIKGKTNHIL